MKILSSIALSLILSTSFCNIAYAHPLAPALYELKVESDGSAVLNWKTPTARPIGSRLRPVVPQMCKPTEAPRRAAIDEGLAVLDSQPLQCDVSKLIGAKLSAEGIESGKITVVVRFEGPNGESARGLLSKDKAVFIVPPKQSRWSVAKSYLRLGVDHLISGVDHVMFVLGLLILIGWNRRLLWAITAFTVGHSVTLALASLGLITFPSRLIEIAIAITILIVALEIHSTKTSAMVRRPWFLPGCFGLLHGMGFASALQETGVPQDEVPLALFSFNVGIELGQLAVVVTAAFMILACRAAFPVIRQLPRSVPAYILGSLAAFWVIERVLVG